MAGVYEKLALLRSPFLSWIDLDLKLTLLIMQLSIHATFRFQAEFIQPFGNCT